MPRRFPGNFLYNLIYRIAYPLVRSFFGFRVTGVESFPLTGGVIVAVNHCAMADPVMVCVACPRQLGFLAKIELFKNPLFGWLMRHLGAIPLNRGATDTGALRAAVQVLEAGRPLLLFPEGTRSKTGRIRKGKRGAGVLALNCGVPVLPAHLSGTFHWIRHLFQRRVTLRFGTPFAASDYRQRGLSDRELTIRILQDTMERIKELQDGNHH